MPVAIASHGFVVVALAETAAPLAVDVDEALLAAEDAELDDDETLPNG